MPDLEGSATEQHLKQVLAREAEANHRYLYFAQRADIEGHPQIASLFRSIADAETGHALGLLDFLSDVADPATGLPAESTEDHLASAVAGETTDAAAYAEIAATARTEGFGEIADWMDTMARAESNQAERLADALRSIR